MINPYVLLVALILSAGYFVGGQIGTAIKKVDRAVVHGAKVAGKKLARVFHHPPEEVPPQP